MKKWIKAVPVLLVVLLSVGVFMLAGCGEDQDGTYDSSLEAEAGSDGSTIPNGIYIGDVNVGGMTAGQAETAIRSYVEDIAQQPVTLAANDKVLKTTVVELGFQEDVASTIEEALNYGKTGSVFTRYKEQKGLEQEDKVLPLVLTPDEQKVETFLEDNAGELVEAPVDYGLTREDGEFVIEEGQAGQEIDVEASTQIIMTSFESGWHENTTINLAINVVEPRGSEEELALVQDVLGRFSTDYSSSSSARKTNIMVGADCIDGTVIYPGETFSVEEAVTPFDAEHGYEQAPSYENGTTVDTYGGGICQVSTTLYNALIRAELEIDERHGHSMTVSYVDPSADAAISEGSKDLKFTNDTDAPIYISGYTDGETISFTVYGHETRPSNRSVSFESETTGTTEPTVEYRASSESFGTIEQVQSAHTGMTAQLWKIVTVDGVEESREVFNSTTYEMSPTIYEVGISTSNSAAESALYAAIDSQDLNRIYSVIDDYSGSGSSSDDADSDSDEDASAESSDEQEETDAGEETANEGDNTDAGDDTGNGTEATDETSDGDSASDG